MKIKNLLICAILCASSEFFASSEALPRDPFASIPDAKPITSIRIKDNANQECMAKFQEFREVRKQQRDKIAEYKILDAYAREIIEIPSSYAAGCYDVLQDIIGWISRPAGESVCGYTLGGDRILTVDMGTLAEVLNLRAKSLVTVQELTELMESKDQIRQYSLLRFFAQKVLHYPQPELDGLSAWLTVGNSSIPGMCMSSSYFRLKCDISLAFKLLSARAGRDITHEFQAFETEYTEKEDRVFLKEDFEMFVGSSTAASATMTFVNEELCENGIQTSRMALPKEYDVSIGLMAAKNTFFAQLVSSFISDASLRIYDAFIIRSQSDTNVAHPDLATASSIEIRSGQIYQDGEILNTGDTIWGLNHAGIARIYPQKKQSVLGCFNHNYLFQEDGIGVPLACGGHLEVAGGKITKINRSSGHYMPTELQFILAVAHLNTLGILAENVILNEGYGTGFNSLAEVLSIANMIEFA